MKIFDGGKRYYSRSSIYQACSSNEQKIKIWQLNQHNTDATESNITNGNRDSKIEDQG